MNGFRQKRTCYYSPLEDRRLLAVSAVLNGGTLTIFGDAAANTVNVQESDAFIEVSGDFTAQYNTVDVSLIRFYGNAGDDFFENTTAIDTVAAGHAGNDTLRTGDGTDRLLGGTGDDTLVSAGGNDRLIGNDGIDMLFGGTGDDTLYGLDGDDTIHGEAGNDFMSGGIGNDIVFGGLGEDTAYGHIGNDSLFGGDDSDRLYGQDGDDTINGDAGDDVVRGGIGNDTLNGNDGNDRILGEQGNDTIHGGAGNETVFAGDGNDTVLGGTGNDYIMAGAGDDIVQGEAGNDRIRGNAGNDTLDGGENADRIAGDDGDDYIIGGSANDTVFGDAGADTIVADSNDRVTGGAGDDILQLSSFSSDAAVYSGDYSNYVVTLTGDSLVIRDTTGADGQDIVTGADSLQFADGSRAAEADVTERIYVQPVVVSNDDGSETATFFGNAAQEFEIKVYIDEIFLQAGIDVEWLETRATNNSFFNYGNGTGERDIDDLDRIIMEGDRLGIGNNDPLILDMYFVNRTPGFEEFTPDRANGLAFLDANGIAMFSGSDNLLTAGDRQIIGTIAAHEIGHNLGLEHIEDVVNLLNPIAFGGFELSQEQINMALNSQFSQIFNAIGSGGSGQTPRVLLEGISLDDLGFHLC